MVKGVLLEATAWAVTILGEMGPHQELSVELGDQLKLLPGDQKISWIYDLDGVGHPTRAKKDLNQRALDLYFAFRVVEKCYRLRYIVGVELDRG